MALGHCTEPGLQQPHRGGCHPVASATSALTSGCSVHPLQPHVLNSQRNFFFFFVQSFGGWSLIQIPDLPLPQIRCSEKLFLVFSLFSLDFCFLSYLFACRHMPGRSSPYFLHLQELAIISLPPCTCRHG